MAKKVATSASVQQQLKALAQRVSWLEAALRPGKSNAPVDPVWADFERKWAEREARNKAMKEYYEQEKIDRYRSNPNSLKIAKELERKQNAFLRERGLTPDPSSIPAEFRRKRNAKSSSG